MARRAFRRTAKRSGRVYRRDRRGRFAPTGSAATSSRVPRSGQRKRRRRGAAIAGTAVVAGAVAVQQARNPASRTRAAMTRHRLVARHVARAQADHEHLAVLRAKAFPTGHQIGAPFDSAARKAARREARKLTAGYRKRAKRAVQGRRAAQR